MAKRKRGNREIFENKPATKLDLFKMDKRVRDIEQHLSLPSPPRKPFLPPEPGDDDYIPE